MTDKRTEKRLALIIASYEYQDPDLRQLVAPAQDAEALARVLKDPAIGGFEVQTLLNEPAHTVTQAVEAFFTDRRRDDLLLLYFSGHGIKDEDGQLYFATAQTRRKLLRSTAVAANFVNDEMRRSRSRRQVLLLDCCYSGAFARGMLAKAGTDIGTGEQFEGRGRVVLTASDAMRYAFEEDKVEGEGARSVFTRVLVHGLETGEADLDRDGRISLDELYEYVHDRVVDETPQQRPGKWDFGVQGKIIIARSPAPPVPKASLPGWITEVLASGAYPARLRAIVPTAVWIWQGTSGSGQRVTTAETVRCCVGARGTSGQTTLAAPFAAGPFLSTWATTSGFVAPGVLNRLTVPRPLLSAN